MRPRTAVGVSVVGGALFGSADSVVNNFSSPYTTAGAKIDGTALGAALDPASLILDAGWAWAAIAVVAGFALARTWRAGVAVGLICLAAATLAYYVVESAFQGGPLAIREIAYFAALSVALGPVLGVIGYRARRADLLGIACRLVVPAGAAAQMLVDPPGFGGFDPLPGARVAEVIVLGTAALAALAIVGRGVLERRA